MIDERWDEDGIICYNCEYMGYFYDGCALLGYCELHDIFSNDTGYCEDFKNRWNK